MLRVITAIPLPGEGSRQLCQPGVGTAGLERESRGWTGLPVPLAGWDRAAVCATARAGTRKPLLSCSDRGTFPSSLALCFGVPGRTNGGDVRCERGWQSSSGWAEPALVLSLAVCGSSPVAELW